MKHLKTTLLLRRVGATLAAALLTAPLIGALTFGPLAPAQAEAALSLPLKDVTVGDGIKAQLVERHTLPLVTLTVAFKGGAAGDPKGKEGLTNLMVDALRAGAGTRNGKALAEALDGLGAELDLRVTRDAVEISLEVLSRDVPQALALLSDLVIRPTFAEDELARIRRQLQAEIQDRLDNPAAAVEVAFYEQLYRNHPYGHARTGTLESVEKLSRADVVALHKALFRPENAWLGVVGDFDPKQLKKQLDQAFKGWSKAVAGTPALKVSVPSAPAPIKGRRIILVHRSGLTQSQIRIGNLAFASGAPGEVERTVVNTALGGGFTSRLVEEIRVNRSLSYGANSNFVTFEHTGPFVISTFTKNETLGETIQVALDTLKGLKDKGMQAPEFEKARASAAGRFAQNIQTPEALLQELAKLARYKLPLSSLVQRSEQLKAVSLEVANRTASALPFDDLLLVVYSDKDVVLPQLQKLGEVCVVEKLEYDGSCKLDN
ncbi:MAG: M16 family metallopeptidase [Myxococcota bacterium]